MNDFVNEMNLNNGETLTSRCAFKIFSVIEIFYHYPLTLHLPNDFSDFWADLLNFIVGPN
jgi:hypothetical protein